MLVSRGSLTGMSQSSSSKIILLVEDEAIIAMNEAATLAKYGYEVLTANSAKGAIETVRETEVDLVLMDIDLGRDRMDGTEAAEIILAEKEIPIVFLSSHSEKEMVERVKGITRYGYVLKNAGEFVLIESITMAFGLFESHVMLKRENEERRRTEASLKERSEFIETVIENLPIGLAINYIDGGKASYMNRQFERIYGWPAEELTDIENFFRLVYPDPEYRDEIKKRVFSDIRSGDPERMVWENIEITTKDGEKRCITAMNIPLFDQNYMISTVQDVTELKAAERTLREKEEQYRLLAENSHDCIAYLDPGLNPLYISPSSREMFGYPPQELNREKIFSLVHPEDRPGLEDKIKASLMEKADSRKTSYRILTKSGELKWIEVIANYLYDESQTLKGLIVNARDITDRKSIENELRRTERLVSAVIESTEDIIVFKDTELIYRIVNSAMCRFVGKPAEELRGKTDFEIFPRDQAEFFRAQDRRVLETGESITQDETADGAAGTLWVNSVKSPVFDRNGECLGVIVTVRDITERKRAEEQLQNALREKDYLMKELNHRVKNNLLMVKSLINLKDFSLGDADLSDLARQVDAIRIVHEKLYQSEDITRIPVEEYLEDLLATVFSFSPRPVEVEKSIDPEYLPSRTAVTVGLIVNEIATNAIKYGFREEQAARFTVELREESGGEYVLVLSNTGRPFPECIDLDHPETLGLRLITALADQLGGTIDLRRTPEPVFTVRFPGG